MSLKKDFRMWGAKILRDGTIRFEEPKIMFLQGSDRLKSGFKKILKEFCPRYITRLSEFGVKNIHEVRIAGHSSSEWSPNSSSKKKHMSNASLSVRRAWSVHEFCYDILLNRGQKILFSNKVVTIGANFVHKIKRENKEIKPLSRRVEFRVQLKILEEIGEYFMGSR